MHNSLRLRVPCPSGKPGPQRSKTFWEAAQCEKTRCVGWHCQASPRHSPSTDTLRGLPVLQIHKLEWCTPAATKEGIFLQQAGLCHGPRHPASQSAQSFLFFSMHGTRTSCFCVFQTPAGTDQLGDVEPPPSHDNEVIKIREDPTTSFLQAQAPHTNICQLVQEVKSIEIKTCWSLDIVGYLLEGKSQNFECFKWMTEPIPATAPRDFQC